MQGSGRQDSAEGRTDGHREGQWSYRPNWDHRRSHALLLPCLLPGAPANGAPLGLGLRNQGSTRRRGALVKQGMGRSGEGGGTDSSVKLPRTSTLHGRLGMTRIHVPKAGCAQNGELWGQLGGTVG